MSPQQLYFILLSCSVIAGTDIAIFSSFFPSKALDIGLSKVSIALIYSVNSITMAVMSLIIGKTMHRKNRQLLQSTGFLILGGAQLLLSLLIYATTPLMSFLIALLSRTINGIGFALYTTPLSATIQTLFEKSAYQKNAATQSMNMIGCLIGPLVGNFYYRCYGFQGPFIMMGILYVFYGLLLFLVATSKNLPPQLVLIQPKVDLSPNNIRNRNQSNIGYFSALKPIEVAICLQLAFAAKFAQTYYMYIFGSYLIETFTVIELDNVGLCLLVIALGHIIWGLVLYFIPLSPKLRSILIFCCPILAGVLQFIYWRDPRLQIHSSLLGTIIVQITSGSLILITIIIGLPILRSLISKRFPELSSADIASAFYNCCLSLGDSCGPWTGYLIDYNFGFQHCAGFLGCFLIFSGIFGTRFTCNQIKEFYRQKIREKNKQRLLESEFISLSPDTGSTTCGDL